jgi:hypothetical protein
MLTLSLCADQRKSAIRPLGAVEHPANLEAAMGALLGFVRNRVTKIESLVQGALPMTTGE